ncbi:MAG: hypothetical protein KDE51_01545 [Anaerolineales bacterium]|nr:hypothetical protein [Anaerolineales bacterium]
MMFFWVAIGCLAFYFNVLWLVIVVGPLFLITLREFTLNWQHRHHSYYQQRTYWGIAIRKISEMLTEQSVSFERRGNTFRLLDLELEIQVRKDYLSSGRSRSQVLISLGPSKSDKLITIHKLQQEISALFEYNLAISMPKENE